MTPRGNFPHAMNVLFCRVEGGNFATTIPRVNFLPTLNILLGRTEKGNKLNNW